MSTRYTSIKLNKGQYLNEVEPFKLTGIPTNHIIHKTITGCGITTLEIQHTKRHSIIILPNVPVIQGKVAKHNTDDNKKHHILGVYKGIEVEHIERYLKSDNVFKKILTTPEGFVKKVVEAFKENSDILLKDYFLLFDECEHIITDVSYRGKIAAPIKDFVRFHNKAMVSATTLPFSDSRFDDFQHIIIEPTYDYSKKIKIIDTNNILQSFNRHIETIKSDHIAIFFNSTDGIFSLIDRLGIKDDSYVFCGQDSVQSLRTKGFRNASHLMDVNNMKKFTFFTSRFFSAVDIEVPYQPDVVLLTDVYFAEHSILDPMTEVIQIAGRYRNGISSLTHISNTDAKLSSKSEQESKYYLEGCFDTYNGFAESLRKADHPGSKDMLKAAIESSPVHGFFDDGQLNTFMVDNFFSEERVKGYYQSPVNLKEVYQKLRSHFDPTFKSELYTLGDYDRLKRGSNMSKKDHYKEIAKQIDMLTPKPGQYMFEAEGERDYLRSKYPIIYKGYYLIGLEGLDATGYVNGAIEAAIREAERIIRQKEIAIKVYHIIDGNGTWSEVDIVGKLEQIYKQNEIKEEAKAAHIRRYFHGRRSTKDGQHVYILTDKIFE